MKWNKLAQALLEERQMKRVACHFGVSRSREATVWEDYAVALAQAILECAARLAV
jgi:hypothetical protein